MDKRVRIGDVIGVLVDEGVLLGGELYDTRKPSLDYCGCQDCGWPLDECICRHNQVLGKLLKIPKSGARYKVLTWDTTLQEYTPHHGTLNPSMNVDWRGLLTAMRELSNYGYAIDDPSLVVEKMD